MRARRLLVVGLLGAATFAPSSSAFATEELKDTTTSLPPTQASPAPPATSPPAAPPRELEQPIVVWPTLTPSTDDVGAGGIRRPSPSEGTLYARALELDATLRDAVQDLGFTLDVADPGPASGRTRELDMLERAAHSNTNASSPTDGGTWVVSARLEPLPGDAFLLRIVVVSPRSKQLRVRVERVSGADVSARGLVFLRDLLSSKPLSPSSEAPRPEESASSGIMAPSRSPGRAVLAANAALFGSFAAFSVQRASGSEDPRLLYPLLTLGTAVGLGSALLVAEEWNVSTGDAWTLAGGAWWGAASGILIANGRKVPLTDRYAWGVGGGLIGLGLATFSVARSKADEGAATLVHSGAGLGLGIGALSQYFYGGDLNQTPYNGAGYGVALGLLAGGVLSKVTKVSASRVLLVDLGVGLGAATGAALGSPLVFENVTQEKTRGFIASTLGGAVIGGATAWFLTRDRAPRERARSAHPLLPYGGAIGASATPRGPVPAYGVGVRGLW